MRDTSRKIALSLLMAASACWRDGTAVPPPRPASVPAAAFWCGGLDGGVFVQLNARGKHYTGTIYTEAGDVWFRGDFRMDPKNKGAAPRRGSAWCGGWDGTRLYLSGGGALIAVGADQQVIR